MTAGLERFPSRSEIGILSALSAEGRSTGRSPGIDLRAGAAGVSWNKERDAAVFHSRVPNSIPSRGPAEIPDPSRIVSRATLVVREGDDLGSSLSRPPPKQTAREVVSSGSEIA